MIVTRQFMYSKSGKPYTPPAQAFFSGVARSAAMTFIETEAQASVGRLSIDYQYGSGDGAYTIADSATDANAVLPLEAPRVGRKDRHLSSAE